MHKQPDKPSFFEKLATAIVDRRNLIFFPLPLRLDLLSVLPGMGQGLQ